MPAKKPNNQEVFEDGHVLNHYVCDMSPDGEHEANGSIEYVIVYRDEKYFVHTDWDGIVINPSQKAIVCLDHVL